MQFLKSTIVVKITCSLCLLFLFGKNGISQINSPYSRYGLGDIYNTRNMATAGMGGLTATYANVQAVNFLNPASYSRLQGVTFDVGVQYENRTISANDQTDRYKSANLVFNYMALGFPIKKNKLGQTVWGGSFGLRPYTRTNYKVEQREKLEGIDSIYTLYEGNGGANKAFIGTGFTIKGLSLGANMGITFGQQDISTKRSFLNDSVNYLTGLVRTNTSYNKFFADFGAQYDIKLSKKSVVRLAVSGVLGQKLNATQDRVQQTIAYNNSGGFDSIDVVERTNNIKGIINLPKSYTVGIAYDKIGRWLIGAEYEKTYWNEYRYYGQKDPVKNTYMFRFGTQILPAINSTKYFSQIIYRAGFYTGNDYVNTKNGQLNLWAATLGFGLPIRRWSNYSYQYSVLNTSIEIGKRGQANQPVSENFIKIGVGLCLSDLWFIKRKFD